MKNKKYLALQQSEERYHKVFKTLIEGFCIIELIFDADDRPVDYRFLETNPAFEAQSGLRDVQGKLVSKLVPDLEAHWFEIYEKVVLTGEPVRLVNEAKGLNRWFDVSAYRIDGPGSRQVAVLFNDITESKRTEKALLQAKEVAEAATRAKSQFLANMSHELRTPMSGVLGMLELVLAGNLEAEQREFIEITKTSAFSLVRILNDILDLTKIEMGTLLIAEKPFSIRKCMENTFKILLPAAKSKGLDLNIIVADNVPKTLVGDQTRLDQVMTNLAGNAVKFTEKGKVEIRIEAGGRAPGGKRDVTFTVADTGIGIPGSMQDLIFQVFSQVDESHSRSYGGTGLGLAISKELVERMGGTITLTSKVGKGSTFSFTLALREAEDKHDAICTLGKTATAAEAPLAEDIRKPRLLLADDDQVLRRVLGFMLQRSNYEIDFAENGQKAVEMWEGGQYDLILMDIQMPRMNGFEATAAIRLIERTLGGHTPIVAVTGHAFKEDEQRCLDAGMDAYISKPIDFEACLQLIVKILKNT